MGESNLLGNEKASVIQIVDTNQWDQLKEALEFFKKSIKGAAPVSVALGSIVTLLYCLRIGYLPIENLESVATLGAAVALTAAIFLLCFFLLLVLIKI
ncbi:MAG: hypothetical protein KAY82_01270 [Hylemonella sp.]|nr:hypothetical protein [Hylemonella sp.]